MKTNVFLGIAWRIVLLFLVAMMSTFIAPMMRDFLGDTYCPTRNCGQTDEEWVWGARHYWLQAMCVVLFLLSLVNVIVATVRIINKNYNL
jgi:hypothetical protein